MFDIHSLFDMFDIVIKIFEMILWRLHHLRSLRTNLANKALSFFDESCSIKLMNKTWKSFADVWPSANLSSHFWVQIIFKKLILVFRLCDTFQTIRYKNFLILSS